MPPALATGPRLHLQRDRQRRHPAGYQSPGAEPEPGQRQHRRRHRSRRPADRRRRHR